MEQKIKKIINEKIEAYRVNIRELERQIEEYSTFVRALEDINNGIEEIFTNNN